jgi:autotransporter-associated beta strand protein
MKCIIEHRLLALSCFLVLAGSLKAATRSWDGGGLDGAFSNPLNWDGNATIPVSNTDVLQAGANTVGGVPFIGFNTGEFRTPSFTFLAGAVAPYTVTAASSSDFLTLTGTGVALLNSSPVRQRFELITTTVGAATQTWDGGAQGFGLAQIDLGNDHILTVDGTGNTAATRNEIKGGITGTMTSGLTKAGSGTLLLDNAGLASDYTGPTTLSNGRLQLGRANQIPDTSKLVLAGGTFDTGGFSDTMGALLLNGSATIDFGISDVVSLIFGESDLELWSSGTLTIVNFTVGADTLRIGTDASALTETQLAQINFNGTAATITSTGFLVPVPEPGVSAALLSTLSIFGFRRRRRLAEPRLNSI